MTQNSEQIILCQIILNNKIFYDMSIKESDFQDPRHIAIFNTIKTVLDKGNKADIKTLFQENRDLDMSYVTEISDCYSSASNYKYWYGQLKEASTLRHLKALPNLITDLCKTGSSQEVLEEIEKKLVEITSRTAKDKVYQLADLIIPQMELIEEINKNRGKLAGISTGYPSIDRLTGGLVKQDMWIIGARPSVGKTAFMGDLILNVGIKQAIPCGIFSAETSKEKLMNRLYSNLGHIDNSKLRQGGLKPSDFTKLTEVSDKFFNSKISICDTPNIRLDELKSKARRMVAVHGVRVIFVDYIGLIKTSSKEPRHLKIAEISMELKQLGRELDITMVVLSQVGRQSEGRPPTLADLRESGQIEQDGDVILFLHHDYDDKDEIIASWILNRKARDGSRGTIEAKFFGEYTSFKEITRVG